MFTNALTHNQLHMHSQLHGNYIHHHLYFHSQIAVDERDPHFGRGVICFVIACNRAALPTATHWTMRLVSDSSKQSYFFSQITIDERDPVSLDAALDEIAFYSSALPPSLIRLHYDETLNHTHGTKGTPYVMANPPSPILPYCHPFLLHVADC